jgi:tetratricopeptide (TPR) repeat protein
VQRSDSQRSTALCSLLTDHWSLIALASALAALALASGCATSRLRDARASFYAGRFDAAVGELQDIPAGNTDRILFLMERGTARQAGGDFTGSIADWLEAARIIEDLDYVSVSRGASSLVANERVQAFRGAPYERTLLHAFAAKSYLALGQWDDAAVEARAIAKSLESLDGYPDDPYSRYVAGFCFEMIGDGDGAALEYRQAGALAPALRIEEDTGRILPAAAATNTAADAATAGAAGAPHAELVCFVLMGRAPAADESADGTAEWEAAPYAEILVNGRVLGRSYPLGDTGRLLAATERRRAALSAVKTGARIAVKGTIAHQIAEQNRALGGLAWLVLFALETPDDRRWATLPRYMQVARVPCPSDLTEYTLVFRGPGNAEIGRTTVAVPLSRRGRTCVSFCRAL